MFGFTPSDATIVRRTMAGRPQAFEALVFRYQKQAFAIARALGHRPPEVEDIVQEAFFQAFRDLPALRVPESFGGWFLNIVRHVAIKELRRSARPQDAARPAIPQVPSPAAPAAGEVIEQKDFREHIWGKVAELPQGTREAIFLFYYEGESVGAVARSLGLSISGAKRRLQTGREALREKLWRGLEECLREAMPSSRVWKASGRRLGLLVLASIPASWTARAGADLVAGGRGDAVALLARHKAIAMEGMKRSALLAAAKKAAALLIFGFLLYFLGRGAWRAWGPESGPRPAVSAAPTASPLRNAADPPAAERMPKAVAAAVPPAPAEAPPALAEEPLDPSSDDRNRGSVLVRVIWSDTRTPAAGVSGQIIPWGSPDLYIDERTFTSGPDGTAKVDRIFKGGGCVMLDRGGRVDVHVRPGEESEAVIEVPPGLNVQGVVVDRTGFPVSGARIWISYGGHMNSGSEVATALADGSFFVRSISSAQYIAARASGHVASDLRPLSGETGATIEVRLILNGPAGELNGTVRDEAGRPVPHAKVMVGAEYPVYALLDDGTTGFTPPPYLGFTGEDGEFHADSLFPGKTRVAVRAPGFVPLAEEVEVPRGSEAAVELTLQRGATLEGHVSGSAGQPLTGAQVVVGDFRDFLSIKVFSGDGGSFRLTGLRPGELQAHSQRPGFGKASAKLTVIDREVLKWDPVLAQDLEISGRLMDESDEPLEGFTIQIEEALDGGGRRATQKRVKTDAGGRFTIGELSDLAYRMTVMEPDNPLPCALIEEVRPAEGALEIRVDRKSFASAFILGRVLDEDGRPFPGAKVLCFSALGGYRVYFTGKDGGGFRAGPLPRGRYRLEVQALGHPALAAGEHEVQEDEERDLGLQYLKPPAR